MNETLRKVDLSTSSDSRKECLLSVETKGQRTGFATWDKGLKLNVPPGIWWRQHIQFPKRCVWKNKIIITVLREFVSYTNRLCVLAPLGRQCSETIEMRLREQRASNKDPRKIKRSHSTALRSSWYVAYGTC